MLVNKLQQEIKNTILNKQETIFKHLGVGVDGEIPNVNQTTLFNEKLRKPRQIDEDLIDGNKITVSLWVSSVEANSHTLVELGLFDADSGGNMWMRELFEPTLKTEDIELWFDVTIENEVVIN